MTQSINIFSQVHDRYSQTDTSDR